MPMQGSIPSKISKNLGNIRTQLKSGKTRGANPRDLDPNEVEALEQQRDNLIVQMNAKARERSVARIISHTTEESNRVIEAVSQNIGAATSASSQFFEAVGGAGSSTDLRMQAAVLRARATEKAKEERKVLKEAEIYAKMSATADSSNTPQRAKRTRTQAPEDQRRSDLEKKSMADIRLLLAGKDLDTKGRSKKELTDRLLAEEKSPVAPDAPSTETHSEAPDETAETPAERDVHIGTVVILKDAHGNSVPADFRGIAVTITAVVPERKEIEFVSDGERKSWHMDAFDPVRAKPLAVDPAFVKWQKSAGPEQKCGHITKTGRFCCWPAPCGSHHKREGEAMAAEDDWSRKADKGICDIKDRNGRICTNAKGGCCVHAPDEKRCTSMLEDNIGLRCWGYKQKESDYCGKHHEFPNLSVNANQYGGDCHRCFKACSLDEFIERFYPAVDKAVCPYVLDEFLAYVKRLSGHSDLWEVRYTKCGPETMARAKEIVGMLLPVRGNAVAHAAHVNHTLSDRMSALRVNATGADFVIGDDSGVKVARLSRS